MKDLLDTDGENRAVRAFLAGLQLDTWGIEDMMTHMRLSGFDKAWPTYLESHLKQHMTKLDQQNWLRYLFALEKPPYAPELRQLQENNVWHNFRQVVDTLKAASEQKWHWFANPQCKYVGLRIDMRDLGCIVSDRDGNRITPEQLAFQHK